jgi:hypothetical protein
MTRRTGQFSVAGSLQRVLATRKGSAYLLSALSLLLFFTGWLLPTTFATSTWYAIDEYQSTAISAATLSPVTGLKAQSSGNNFDLAWTPGASSTTQLIGAVNTTTSDTCGSSQSFSPVAETSGASYSDVNRAGQAISAGQWFCYQLTTTYPTPVATTTLRTALTSGTSYTSLAVPSLPYAVTSGDTILVSGTGSLTGYNETFVASGSVAATTSATTIPVTSKSANASYTTTATVSDTSTWPATTLHTALTSGTNYTSLSVANLPYPVTSGDQILVMGAGALAGDSEYFVATSNVAASTTTTSIPVTSKSANASYTTTATISDVAWPQWTSSTSSYANALYGFVPVPNTNPWGLNGVALANANGTIASGDTITLTYNQAIAKPASSYDVCVIGGTPSTIIIDDTSQTTCKKPTVNDTSLVGNLVSVSGSATSGTYTATYTTGTVTNSFGTFGTLKITLGGATSHTDTVTSWTYTPSSGLKSSNGSVAACTTCTVTATGSF